MRLNDLFLQCSGCIVFLIAVGGSNAATHSIQSADDLETLVEAKSIAPGDVIIWADGTYTDQEITFNNVHGTAEAPIRLKAESPGGVIFHGESMLRTNASWWIVEGFHFDGDKGGPNAYNAIQFRGADDKGAEHVRLTNCAFTSLQNADDETAKWVQIYGRFNQIDHCHFSGKPNKGALITIELDAVGPEESANHVLESNYFADIQRNEGSDNETIRIGFSGDQNKPARCVVRNNLFLRCNGESEIVSNKSSYNTFSGNTFRQCNGSLVLRHGHHATVSGNRFLGEGAEDAGGIRINDSHHDIFNNYMQDLTGLTWNAALSIEGGNKPSGGDSNGYQAVDGVRIVHNTIVNCRKSVYLSKKHGKRKPTGVFANNLVVRLQKRDDDPPELVDAELELDGIAWQTNLFFGLPSGVTDGGISADPLLELRDGSWRPTEGSPIIDAATGGYPMVNHDIDGRKRLATARDIGAIEFAVGATEQETQLLNTVGTNYLAKHPSEEAVQGNKAERPPDAK